LIPADFPIHIPGNPLHSTTDSALRRTDDKGNEFDKMMDEARTGKQRIPPTAPMSECLLLQLKWGEP